MSDSDNKKGCCCESVWPFGPCEDCREGEHDECARARYSVIDAGIWR